MKDETEVSYDINPVFDKRRRLKINRIILKIETPSIIQNRLMKRDNSHWNRDLIDSFQAREQKRVIEFARLEKIPMFVYDNDSKLEELKQFLL